jgi:predicted DNA-binding ribbon-helix-helix protein
MSAAKQGATISSLVTTIESNRKQSNLSSEIRLFVLEHYRSKGKEGGGGHEPLRLWRGRSYIRRHIPQTAPPGEYPLRNDRAKTELC